MAPKVSLCGYVRPCVITDSNVVPCLRVEAEVIVAWSGGGSHIHGKGAAGVDKVDACCIAADITLSQGSGETAGIGDIEAGAAIIGHGAGANCGVYG